MSWDLSHRATTELLRNAVAMMIIQVFLYQIAGKAALEKRLFSAVWNDCIFSCYEILHFRNLAALHGKQISSTWCVADSKHCYKVAIKYRYKIS